LETEVDIDTDGLIAHRYLFHPRDELSIDCSDVTVKIESRYGNGGL
jgi:hypothetical protein